MADLGLVWIASWISCLVSSAQTHFGVVLQSLPRSVAIITPTISPEADLYSQVPRNQDEPIPTQNTGWLNALENLLVLSNPLTQGQSFQIPSNQLNPLPLHRKPSVTEIMTIGLEAEAPIWSLDALFHRSWDRVHTITAGGGLPQVVVVKAGHNPSASHGFAQLKQRGFWRCLPRLGSQENQPPDATGFQIWVRGCRVATLPTEDDARELARTWQQVLHETDEPTIAPEPMTLNGLPGGRLGNQVLFTITPELATQSQRDAERLAIEWVNDLRIALAHPPLNVSQAQIGLYNLVETGEVIEGLASWYGPYFHGALTAQGEIFNQNELTAAHPSLPFDTYLWVTNLNNGRSVLVRVNDRGPYIDGRILDLSREAARILNGVDTGIFPVEAVVMVPGQTPAEPTKPNQQELARL